MKSKSTRLLRLAAFAALAAASFGLAFLIKPSPPIHDAETAAAVRYMEEALKSIARGRLASGAPAAEPASSSIDTARLALIGAEYSPTTTTRGSLAAKLTSTDPRFAAAVVVLLRQAGVRRGEAAAIGASGSFPGLLAAVLSACRALELRPVVILSLGASQWGANLPGFGLLEQYDCMAAAGLGSAVPPALSIGGENDTGGGLDPDGAALLRAAILGRGAFFIDEPDQFRNVARRMEYYEKAAGTARLAVFVNIGGAQANVGRGRSAERFKPGLNRSLPPATVELRGTAQEFAGRGLPVVHLLEIRSLAARFGIDWVEAAGLPRY